LGRLVLLALMAAACASSPSESSLGQLRLRPAFAEGENPDAFGVEVEKIRVVVRRDGGNGEMAVDTTMDFEEGVTLSWILDLANPPELLDVSADLDGGGRVLYRGSLGTSVGAGVGSGVAITDLLVRYVGPVVTAIDVTPAAVTFVTPGGTQQFQAVALGAGGAPETGFAFTWSSSDPAVATVDPGTGLATAVGTGSTIISATAGGRVGTARLTLSPIASIVVLPAGASLSALGDQQQFVAQALDAAGSPIPDVVFTWSSETPGVATIDPATGLATAVTNGAAAVRASAAGMTGSTTLEVQQVIASITVSPDNPAFTALGATIPFTAEARDANGFLVANTVFTWSSPNPAVATVGASSGVARSVGVGTTSVVATAAGVSGFVSVAVSQVITSIVVTPATASLTSIGSTQQYSAVAFDANGHAIPGVQFAWSSSVTSVAVINLSSGLATSTATGSTTIGASAGGVTATAPLTVTQSSGLSITIVPLQAILTDLGTTQQFTAVATEANGAVIPGVLFTWTSAAPAVATIGVASGLATATGFGVTTITATGAGLSSSATLVVSSPVASVEVLPASASLAAGSSLAFTAVGRDAGGNIVPGAVFLWSSSAPGVASVNIQTGLVTAVAAGTATIFASVGTTSGRATVSVTSGGTGPVASVTVSPNPGVIDALGDTQTFQAVARDASGNVMPGIAFAWTSAAPGIATVDQSGLVTAVSTGTASVNATAGGVTGSAAVEVRQIVASVSVQPTAATLSVGDNIPLTALARDARGNAIAGVSFTWSSADASVATVDANGLVHAMAGGTTTVLAAANGITATATVDVVRVGSIVISPRQEPAVQVGATIQFTAQVFDPAGNLLPNERVTWSSSQPLIATIDAVSGLATGLARGNSAISATSGGVTKRVFLRVN